MTLHVDFAGMTAAQQRLSGLVSDCDKPVSTAKDADPEWFIWGLCGAPLAAGYFPLSDTVHEHLSDLKEALQANSDRIKGCAEQYHLKEEDNAKVMEIIKRKLDDK